MSDAMSRKIVIKRINEAMGDPKVPGYYTIALQEALRLLELLDAVPVAAISDGAEELDDRYCYAQTDEEADKRSGLLCVNGMQHSWQPTGKRWATWSDSGTSSAPPPNAPVLIEQQCAICKLMQQIYVGSK